MRRSHSLQRLIKQLRNFEIDKPYEDIELNIHENDYYHWEAKFIGPNDTPYQGGIFLLDIVLLQQYPIRSPIVKFKTKIYHPNVYQDGSICLCIFKKQYAPSMTVQNVVLSIQSLLGLEDIERQYNQGDAVLLKSPQTHKKYLENKLQFIKIAKEWTNRHAKNSFSIQLGLKTSDNYQVFDIKPLGNGSFGTVFYGWNKITKERVAIQQILKTNHNIKSQRDFRMCHQANVAILRNIKSENLVAVKEILYNQQQQCLFIVMELCGMSLTHRLKHFKHFNFKMGVHDAISIFATTCNGFLSLVEKGVLHSNLKPDNILIKGHQAKVSGYGLSTNIKNREFSSFAETKKYMAPQIKQHKFYTSKCDIWSLGVILYQMLLGKIPQFTQIKSTDPQFKKHKEQFQASLYKLDKKTKNVIERCLEYKQQQRISWDQLFRHPIFSGKLKPFTDKNKKIQTYIIPQQINQINQKIQDKYDINFFQPISDGRFGRVILKVQQIYPGLHKETSKKVAIKQILKKHQIFSEDEVKKFIQNEITILKNTKSENVVSFQEVFENKSCFYIVMQLCQMNLQQFIKNKEGKKLSEQLTVSVFIDICNGFLPLIKQGFMHRDLKLDNILMQGNRAKVADFGISTFIDRQTFTTGIGTNAYKAPQVHQQNNNYTSKVDIWALGIILYQMIQGKKPQFTQIKIDNIEQRQSKRLSFLQSLNKMQINENTKNLIGHCLKQKQDQRISWDELFLHPIFQGRFQPFANKNNKFESKIKHVLARLRISFNNSNMDLKNLALKFEIQENKNIDFNLFKQIINQIDLTITTELLEQLYTSLEQNQDNSVTLQKLMHFIKQKQKGYNLQDSLIINTKQDVQKLMTLFNKKILQTKLHFQATRDSFKAKQFHKKCNGVQDTLTIIETTQGKIIGGFTPCKWNSSDSFSTDNNRQSFIFQFNYSDKFTLKKQSTKYAIWNNPNYGPAFGEGHDICISNEANINSNSYAIIDGSYYNASYFYQDDDSHAIFSGDFNFMVNNYEVWEIIFQ